MSGYTFWDRLRWWLTAWRRPVLMRGWSLDARDTYRQTILSMVTACPRCLAVPVEHLMDHVRRDHFGERHS